MVTITGGQSKQNPPGTKKPCIPICLHIISGSDYCAPPVIALVV